MPEAPFNLPRKRTALSPAKRQVIRDKTGGVCHICGGSLGDGWVVDHVRPLAKGGDNTVDNFLPACTSCNRLKWHRSPEAIRLIMQLGIYAKKEIERNTPLGRRLEKLLNDKVALNCRRRTVGGKENT